MNVASKELSQELYKLSGWDDMSLSWQKGATDWYVDQGFDEEFEIPAYDLGYLLRKLPTGQPNHSGRLTPLGLSYRNTFADWLISYPAIIAASGDTPEDAAAKLSIGLFKSKTLTREEENE